MDIAIINECNYTRYAFSDNIFQVSTVWLSARFYYWALETLSFMNKRVSGF